MSSPINIKARRRRQPSRGIQCCALAAGLALAYSPTAFAQDPDPTASGSSQPSTPANPADGEPLAPLPEVPSQDLPQPSAEQLAEVKALLDRVVSPDSVLRERAVRELVEADPKWTAAISHSLDKLADATKGEDLKRKLLDVRDKGRSAERERMKAAGKRGKVETPDYMEMLAQFPEPKDENWRAVTQVVALSRMLREIGTTEAVRELIRIYVRFGEFLRVDTQLQLDKLGDKALPALIEARRHQAPKISRWADRQLDSLGKAIASEAVQTPDPDVLADVLRAYGYTRDPDAARVVISFANSERPQVREAARQAVALMKEVANWPLRDTYANIVGKKPPADWAWERTARELFGEFDRLRLAQVYKLFAQGIAAQKSGDLEGARAAFDKVLARSPLFSRRAEMVDTYVSFADSKLDADPKAAEAALRRARRLSADGKVDKRVESLLWFIEGQDLVARGVADQVPFRRALELDPDNGHARDALAEIQRGEQKQKKKSDRFFAAGAIGVVALLAIAVIALRRGSPVPRLPEQPAIVPEPSEEPTPDQGSALGEAEPGDSSEAGEFPKLASAAAASGSQQPRPEAEAGNSEATNEPHAEAPPAPQPDPQPTVEGELSTQPDTSEVPSAASATYPTPSEKDRPAAAAANETDPPEVASVSSDDPSAPVERAPAANPASSEPQTHVTPALPPTKKLQLPELPGVDPSAALKLPPIDPDQK